RSGRPEDLAEARKAPSNLVDVFTTEWVNWKSVTPPPYASAKHLHAEYLRYLEEWEPIQQAKVKELLKLAEDETMDARAKGLRYTLTIEEMTAAQHQAFKGVKDAHEALKNDETIGDR